jgi:hypothetical protein
MKRQISLIVMGIVTVVSLIYAAVKHNEANKQAEIALRAMRVAEESRHMADVARMEALKQRDAAEHAMMEASKQHALALELANASKKR